MSDNNNRFKVLNIGVGEKQKYSKIYYSNENSNVGASIYKISNKNNNSEIIKIDTIDNILSNLKKKKICNQIRC